MFLELDLTILQPMTNLHLEKERKESNQMKHLNVPNFKK